MDPLQSERYYHIYNHGNARDEIFLEPENYRFFMEKYRQHVLPVVNTYAYCLMPNHFHFFVRIKSLDEYLSASEDEKFCGFLKRSKVYREISFTKVQNFRKAFDRKTAGILETAWLAFVSKQYANFFSSDTQAFNKMYERKGALFLGSFKRRMVKSSEFRNLLLYILCNPVHHGFVSNAYQWKYNEPKNHNPVFSDLDLTMLRDCFASEEELEYAILNNKYTEINEEYIC